ncbi:MAG: sigma 54-interacting transcriptional regulator [Ruminococcus sp.]|nr:sigma 54-interacting transcriptional regulator [Ruminococcus sp.]
MAGKDTRHQVLEYLEQITENTDFQSAEKYSAASIAGRLNISRTAASQYLNEAAAAGILVKVNTRPVYFFDRRALERKAYGSIPVQAGMGFQGNYSSLDELEQEVLRAKDDSVFSRMIGSKGSLSYNVEQCKAAITYPKAGLPILLLGETGTGKSYLARMMYEYARQKDIIGPEGQYVSVNCAEYANNAELFLTNLFGYRKGAYTGADKDRKGLIAMSDGGVLFLDEVHCLSSQCQEKLFHFMDKGQYHMVGDNERWYTARTRIVMATTENPEMALLKTLTRRIPLVTRLAALEDRPQQEKKEILYSLLCQEEQRIERQIRIVGGAYHRILEYQFSGNVGEMVNCVRTCSANAYLDSQRHGEEQMTIYMHHLPDYVLKNYVGQSEETEEKSVLTMEELRKELQVQKKIYLFNRDLLRQIRRILREQEDIADLVNISRNRFSQYMDEISFDTNREDSPKDNLYMEIVKQVCQQVGKRRGITFSNQDILNAVGILDLFIAISTFAVQSESRQTIGIVLAHGYSTASSMAATANDLLGNHIFDGVDMPVNVSSEEIARKIAVYIRQLHGVKDIILMVDFGSLLDIYTKIDGIHDINLGMIGDTSLKLMVMIGEYIRDGMPISKILEAVEDYKFRPECHYIENRKKTMAILSVCATGMGMAERIADLLAQSLPVTTELKMIPYNYGSLSDAGRQSPVFEKYNVLFIIGTSDPGVEGVPYISLDNMIQQHNSDEINGLFSKVLSREELRQFNDNLVKNFSLTNLVGHLTILNPQKVIEFAEKIIRLLQIRTGVPFKNKTKVGLYIHICCMIERLIVDKVCVSYEDVERFEEDKKEFIGIVRECFQEAEKYYGLAIPVSEIAYLYEYIYNG